MMQSRCGNDCFGVCQRRFGLTAQFKQFRRPSRNIVIDGMGDERREKFLSQFLIVGLGEQPDFKVRPDGRMEVALLGQLLRKGQGLGDATQAADKHIGVE